MAFVPALILEGIRYTDQEVIAPMSVCVRVRGSRSWSWWLDLGFHFASCILNSDVFEQTDRPSERTVGCMTKVERSDHRFCFTRLGGSGASRPQWLSIGAGGWPCIVVCCRFCCWHLVVFWLCIPVPIQTRKRDRRAKLSAIHAKHACHVRSWEHHNVPRRKSHPQATFAESHPRWLTS